MNRTRAWIGGLCLCAPCAILALAMTPGTETTPSGSVRGRITYNGSPLDGGYIVFEPAEGNPDDWACGPIERDGHYSITPKWDSREHGEERFRIGIVPGHMKLSTSMPSPIKGAEPDVVLMSLSSEDDGVPMSHSSEPEGSLDSVAEERRFPERFTHAQTSGLQVTLRRGPSHVEIDLKD
jgi:hypothetical protein